MKKKWIVGSIVILLIISAYMLYMNRPMTMNDLKDKPFIIGTVMEVSEDSILIMTQNEDESTLYWVSLKTKLNDSMKNFSINQQVKVIYDGIVLRSYPGQIKNVYAILLNENNPVDLIPMVMIQGKLYFDTNQLSDIDKRCGVMDGEIDSQVSGSMIPVKDDQSNFGTGYSYQFVDENNVDIFINGSFYRFSAK
ncbi:DUF3221 domain-containing protein [Anaerorhabdus sp.]|uniref:DUF3221 domain-containing protein n=1 Tax=Anaerorhabdus sp. TaxID=1872524 RepID=UPI002FC636B7